ncbi:DUF1810 domain-containing protein [Flavobacterium sp. RHBU_24]|uniref:DUF1810 domain-containing protein n=1 Tax=Flavobacterium sp. RHBU_24 TaxID=3391185 RepID=UPI0039848786
MEVQRFLAAQQGVYFDALEEIKAGSKRTHWMWFIFPQLKGLGHSPMANYYGIKDIGEAEKYHNHPILGSRLVEISKALLSLQGVSVNSVFGYPDDAKLHSSMTLFSHVPGADPVFEAVLDLYFDGKPDALTVQLLSGANQR